MTYRRKALEDRFFSKIEVTPAGCWQWSNIVDGNQGYAYFWADDKRHRAHRWAYERFIGPIPDGLHLDHLCRNRGCVNPAHLEPVTPAENSRRSPIVYASTCAEGHPYIPGSYYTDRGNRCCKVCKRERVRDYQQRTGRNTGRYICPICGEERSKPHRAKHLRWHATTTDARPA